MIQDIDDYEVLPRGDTVLGFVEQQVQPIVYRLQITDDQLHIYRLNDKRLFKLPLDLKPMVWID